MRDERNAVHVRAETGVDVVGSLGLRPGMSGVAPVDWEMHHTQGMNGAADGILADGSMLPELVGFVCACGPGDARQGSCPRTLGSDVGFIHRP